MEVQFQYSNTPSPQSSKPSGDEDHDENEALRSLRGFCSGPSSGASIHLTRQHRFHHAIRSSSRRSLLGRGKKVFAGTASSGETCPINSAISFSCCRNAMTASGDGGVAFSAVTSVLSRSETLIAVIATQIAARALQALGEGRKMVES
jgi:hypothetical protein